MEIERPLPFRKNTDSQNLCYLKAYVQSSVIPISKELIKEANSIFLRFYLEWEK